jgi:RimJ/RimL family protein N-acetyltransferase
VDETLIAIPTLRTERLVLRAFRASDLDRLAEMQADPEVMRFLGTGAQRARGRTREESWNTMVTILGLWAMRGYGLFAVEEAATGVLAGRVGILHPYDWPEPELAWALARPFWGLGYAREAAAAARDWAFVTRGFVRLASYIDPKNARSQATAARLGAVKSGMIELQGMAIECWLHYPPGRGPTV